jgi:hypothetical protein
MPRQRRPRRQPLTPEEEKMLARSSAEYKREVAAERDRIIAGWLRANQNLERKPDEPVDDDEDLSVYALTPGYLRGTAEMIVRDPRVIAGHPFDEELFYFAQAYLKLPWPDFSDADIAKLVERYRKAGRRPTIARRWVAWDTGKSEAAVRSACYRDEQAKSAQKRRS